MAHRTLITEEKIKALRSEISTLTEGFDMIADHIVVTDPDANIIYANKAAEKHTGYTFAEMVGKTPGDLWGGRMPKDFYERMWEQLKRFKVPYRGEVENKNKDGYTYWQEVMIYPILDEKSEVKFFVGVEPDATLRKAFEINREKYVGELERLLKYMEGKEVKLKALTEEVVQLRERLRQM